MSRGNIGGVGFGKQVMVAGRLRIRRKKWGQTRFRSCLATLASTFERVPKSPFLLSSILDARQSTPAMNGLLAWDESPRKRTLRVWRGEGCHSRRRLHRNDGRKRGFPNEAYQLSFCSATPRWAATRQSRVLVLLRGLLGGRRRPGFECSIGRRSRRW